VHEFSVPSRQGKSEAILADRIAQLNAMLQAEPNDTFCLYGLAMEYAKSGRISEAIEQFDRTLTIDPNYCYAYFHKAKAQEEIGQNEAAAMTLREGLQRAKSVGDVKAANEIGAYLDELT
jgi:Tfp pilus assembly protein PilF